MIVSAWVPDIAKPWFEEYMQPTMTGIEFGSGCSTIWFGQHVKQLFSVEHDKYWYKRTQTFLRRYKVQNVNLLYRPTLQEYYNTLNAFEDESLDFIFNDGPAESRSPLIIQGFPKIKKGGVLIADNTDLKHSKKGIKHLEKNGVHRRTFYSSGVDPWTLKPTPPWELSVWKKK